MLRDSLVIDIEIATYALEVLPEYPHVPMPEDMLELIGRWDYGLKYRLFEMVNHVVNNDLLTGDGRADYVYDVSELRTRPPIMYPGKILNAAVNFYSHVNEGATPEERAAEMRRRREERGVPYLFQKPSRGAVIGNGDSIVIPYGRDRMDWEVELGAVIGRAAKYVSADDAQDYVFGYLVSIDVSDRGGRPARGGALHLRLVRGEGPRHVRAPGTVDYAPKEFYGDPMAEPAADAQRRRPDAAGGARRRHDPLAVGDYRVRLVDHHAVSRRRHQQRHVGRHRGRRGADTRGEEDRYLKPGEVVEASIDGIGTLRMPVVAGEQPTGLTGAELPPVSSYRE